MYFLGPNFITPEDQHMSGMLAKRSKCTVQYLVAM
jgi:hypothetical protein